MSIRCFHFRALGLGTVVALLFETLSIQAVESLPTKATELLRDVKRVVFLGDSITQKGDYIADVECWLLSKGITLEVLDLGLASETATVLTPKENEGHLERFGFERPFVSERLGRVLEQAKPDLLFVCYGMNDGVELARFSEAIIHLRSEALKSGVKKLVFCTPPVRDNKQNLESNPEDQKLAAYTEWFLEKRKEGWLVVDVHSPMREALDQARSENPDFVFAEDGVHPNRKGHWLIAQQILLQAFGANTSKLASAEQLFPSNGDQVRSLVFQRLNMLSNAWMTKIGHTRPFIPGGPKSQPGLPLPEAEQKAKMLTNQIAQLLSTPTPQP